MTESANLILVDQVELYLAAFYPRMPEVAREAIIRRYMKKPLTGRLPKIAGIVTNNHARHVFTRYEALLEELSSKGVENHRDKARRQVSEELNLIIKKWCRGAPVRHPELGKIRRAFRRLRTKQKNALDPEIDDGAVIAKENEEIAGFCRKWLDGHFHTIDDL